MSERNILRALLNPGIYAGALITALLVVLAYQVRPTYDIPFGTATDGPILHGFNAGEQVAGQPDSTFRWSKGDASITLQDVGSQDFDVVLSVDGSRPAGQLIPKLAVMVDNTVVLNEQPAPGLHDYDFGVSREDVEDGTLAIHLASNAFTPSGDPRELGVMVRRLKVSPSANPDLFVEPPLGVLFSVTLASLLLGLILALLGWGVISIALGGTSVGLLAAWLLVADRLWLTSGRWYQTWTAVLFGGALLVGLVWLVGGWLLRRKGTPWSPLHRRAVLTLMLLAFAVRLAGQLHPQIFVVDLMFHAHRFETVQSGQLLFTILSAEWGGRETFYLPTAYVFMLPLLWLFGDELLVIKLFTVAISTLGAFVVFFMARRTLNSGRIGLIASALYLTVPLSVLPFSWGITTNVFGEFFALLSLAIAVTAYDDLRPNRLAFWALLFCLLIALLSHPGVVQLTLVAFAFISLLWLLWGRIIGEGRNAWWLLGALALASGTAYVVYYSHFAEDMLRTLKEIQADRVKNSAGGFRAKIGGSVADKSLGLVVQYVDTRSAWLFGGLRGFWQEAQAYYRVWPVVGALFGYLLVWPSRPRTARKSRDHALLAMAATGWMLAVVLFAVVGLVANLYVRYALFALPVVALGAGVLLSGAWGRGRAGIVLTILLLAFFAVEALALWQYRITYAFK